MEITQEITKSRLDKIESQLRILKLLLFLSAMTIAFIVLSGLSRLTGPTVKTSGLFVTDNEGNMRISAMALDGSPSLVFIGADDQPVMIMKGEDNGARIDLFAGGEDPQMILKTTKQGPYIDLFDDDSMIRSRLRIDYADNNPFWLLYDKTGQTRAGLSVDSDGGFIGIYDADGNPAKID